MTKRIHSFEPIMDQRTQVLILGSLPGKISLATQEYYASPCNQFWSLLGFALGISFLSRFSYQNRLRLTQHLGVGIWSSIASGEREIASLDVNIRGIEGVNLFEALQEQEVDNLQAIFFDGRLAQSVFMKEVYWGLPAYYQQGFRYCYLPSSSPTYAVMNFMDKARLWRGHLREHLSYFSGKSE